MGGLISLQTWWLQFGCTIHGKQSRALDVGRLISGFKSRAFCHWLSVTGSQSRAFCHGLLVTGSQSWALSHGLLVTGSQSREAMVCGKSLSCRGYGTSEHELVVAVMDAAYADEWSLLGLQMIEYPSNGNF